MSYEIQTINETELVGFLLDPYRRTACLGTRILQKYPKDHLSDDILIFEMSDSSCAIYGSIDYVKKEIIADNTYLLNYDVTEKAPFFKVQDLKQDLIDRMKNDLEMMKITKLSEVKLNSKYITIYEEYKAKCLQPMIFALIGTCAYYPEVRDRTSYPISKFVAWLTIDNIVDIRAGKTELLDKELEIIFNSENFLLSRIVIPTLKAEAKEIVENAKFSKRQLHLKKYMDKTKNCGATRFTVETTAGEKLSCQNRVDYDGSIPVVGRIMKYLDFEDIGKVTYKSKVIYKKDVFL